MSERSLVTGAGHPSPRPCRQREGSESPSAVSLAGQKSLVRQTFGEREVPGVRVKAKLFRWPSASLDPNSWLRTTAATPPADGESTSTQNDEGPFSAVIRAMSRGCSLRFSMMNLRTGSPPFRTWVMVCQRLLTFLSTMSARLSTTARRPTSHRTRRCTRRLAGKCCSQPVDQNRCRARLRRPGLLGKPDNVYNVYGLSPAPRSAPGGGRHRQSAARSSSGGGRCARPSVPRSCPCRRAVAPTPG